MTENSLPLALRKGSSIAAALEGAELDFEAAAEAAAAAKAASLKVKKVGFSDIVEFIDDPEAAEDSWQAFGEERQVKSRIRQKMTSWLNDSKLVLMQMLFWFKQLS